MEEKINKLENLLVKLIEKLNFQQKEIIDIDEAEILTNLKKSYIYKLNHEGKIPCYSYSDNGKLYFKRSEIEKWMTKTKRFYKEDVEHSLSAIFT
uniref:helix-turn-helix transcriptional regulator n=1 Tax=Mariniflexile sp. TaxID=1979402 RepID=UPI0040479D21